MIRKTLALAFSVLLTFSVGCSSSGSRDGKGYFGPGSGAAPNRGCASDVDGDTTQVATTLSSVPYAGTIDCAGDQDVFAVFINPGTISIAAQSSGDTLVVLFASDGVTVLSANDDDPAGGNSARIAGYTITQAGVYYIGISAGAAAPESTPSYTLQVQ